MLSYGSHIAGGNPGSGARVVEFGAALDIAAGRAAKILRALSSRDQNLVIGKLRPAVAESSHAHAAGQAPCVRCGVIQLRAVGIEPPPITATGHKNHAVCCQERGDVLRPRNVHGSGQSPGSRFGIKQFRARDGVGVDVLAAASHQNLPAREHRGGRSLTGTAIDPVRVKVPVLGL